MKDLTGEFLKALLAAPADCKEKALRVLRGETIGERPADTGPLLLSMSEAARILGVSRPTMWRMIKSGRLRRVEIMPGTFRMSRMDLEAFAKGPQPTGAQS